MSEIRRKIEEEPTSDLSTIVKSIIAEVEAIVTKECKGLKVRHDFKGGYIIKTLAPTHNYDVHESYDGERCPKHAHLRENYQKWKLKN